MPFAPLQGRGDFSNKFRKPSRAPTTTKQRHLKYHTASAVAWRFKDPFLKDQTVESLQTNAFSKKWWCVFFLDIDRQTFLFDNKIPVLKTLTLNVAISVCLW